MTFDELTEEQKESLLRKQIEAEIRNELVQEYHSNYVDDEDEDDEDDDTE